jgi:hypothetical protein
MKQAKAAEAKIEELSGYQRQSSEYRSRFEAADKELKKATNDY